MYYVTDTSAWTNFDTCIYLRLPSLYWSGINIVMFIPSIILSVCKCVCPSTGTRLFWNVLFKTDMCVCVRARAWVCVIYDQFLNRDRPVTNKLRSRLFQQSRLQLEFLFYGRYNDLLYKYNLP